MLDVRKLKAQMVLYDYNNATMAKELGMSSKTFGKRLDTGDFGTKEIEIMMKKLHISDPTEIFFANV